MKVCTAPTYNKKNIFSMVKTILYALKIMPSSRWRVQRLYLSTCHQMKRFRCCQNISLPTYLLNAVACTYPTASPDFR